MRILIISLIILIWQFFFTEIPVLGYIDMFLIFSSILFFVFDDEKMYLYWVFFMSILVDIFTLHWVGVYAFIVFSAFLILFVLNKFFKVFQNDRKNSFLILFLIVASTLYSIIPVFINKADFNLGKLIISIFLNIFISIIINSKFKTRDVIQI